MKKPLSAETYGELRKRIADLDLQEQGEEFIKWYSQAPNPRKSVGNKSLHEVLHPEEYE